ncbi:MAG: glycosyltransferase family 4 protein [Saprospiraceae bacterium]
MLTNYSGKFIWILNEALDLKEVPRIGKLNTFAVLMNILILCKKFPYPLKEGEPIAISYLARSLYEGGCTISLFVLNTSKHFFDPANLPPNHNFYRKIYTVEQNIDITISGAVKSMIKGESYILSRFDSEEYGKKLTAILMEERFDVIQLETIYMAHYIKIIRRFSNAVIALRTHNVEHLIWDRVATMTRSFFKRNYLRYQNQSLKKFELNKIQACDILTAITNKDLEIFRSLGFKKEGLVAPVGINIKEYDLKVPVIDFNQTIGFIGALDWMPNQDGVSWFLEKVWPAIEIEFPKATFHIAGKNTPDWIFEKKTNKIVVHGEVDDAKVFIGSHPILVAPLFSGSGIKVKVLEGMALGKVIITTSIGVEGIPAIHGVHVLIADDKTSFIEAIKICFYNQDKMKDIGFQARKFIKNNFDAKIICKNVLHSYQHLVDKRANN